MTRRALVCVPENGQSQSVRPFVHIGTGKELFRGFGLRAKVIETDAWEWGYDDSIYANETATPFDEAATVSGGQESCAGRKGDTSLYPHLIGCLKCVFLLCNMGKYASSSLLQDRSVVVSAGEGGRSVDWKQSPMVCVTVVLSFCSGYWMGMGVDGWLCQETRYG